LSNLISLEEIMNGLSSVLVFKIVVTFFLWWLPLAFFPDRLIVTLGFPTQTSYIFIRLLGMAYFSLGVGYAFGLVGYKFGLRDSLESNDSRERRHPLGVIWTGIVSNGGTCLLLAYFEISGTWSTWGVIAQAFMWLSLILTGIITIGLIVTGVMGPNPKKSD
jgi:hypothetical protein